MMPLTLLSAIILVLSLTPLAFAQNFVSTDKPMYLDGEKITITGTVPEYETYPVSIEIVDPVGKSINTIPLTPNYYGDYFLIVDTGGIIWQHDGVYDIIVSHASFPNSEKITFEYFHSLPKPIPLSAGNLGEDVAKATISATITGSEYYFSHSSYQHQSPWIRLEDNKTIHRYASGVTLDFLFKTIGLYGNNDGCYLFYLNQNYCSNAYLSYKFFINDQHVTESDFLRHVIQQGDELRIVYDDKFFQENAGGTTIPTWIKDIANFWCNDEIEDSAFVDAIQYLMENNVIVVPKQNLEAGSSQAIPSWIKSNACWWSSDQISDNDFASGLEFLIKIGILVV